MLQSTGINSDCSNLSAEAFGAGGSNGGVQVVSTVVGAFVNATALTDVTSIALVSRLHTALSGNLEENLTVTYTIRTDGEPTVYIAAVKQSKKQRNMM